MKRFEFVKLQTENLTKSFANEKQAVVYAKKTKITDYTILNMEGWNKLGRLDR